MKVRINAQSAGKNGPKKSETSGAFLVSLIDTSDVDRELLEFSKVADDGTPIVGKFFRGAYEMWFPLGTGTDGKPVQPGSVSFYDAVVAKLAELKASGSMLQFEFEPRFSRNSKGELAWGNRPDTRQFLYQTITVGFNSMGVKRFSVVDASPVEGL